MNTSNNNVISDFFAFKKKYTDDVYGVEIECESTNHYDVYLILKDIQSWIVKEDGSLRNIGREFVSNPLSSSEAKKETTLVVNNLLNVQGIIKDCPRAGIHIHHNVQHKTHSQVWTEACLYWTLEPWLMDWCGPTRVGNNFCLRLKDATRLVGHCVSHIRDSYLGLPSYVNASSFQPFKPSSCKYAGLNLATVGSLGTLEYRGLSGELDPERIGNWIDQISLMSSLANEFRHPQALFEWINNQDSAEVLFSKLLTPYFYKTLNITKMYESLFTNIGLPLTIAFACSDWDKYETLLTKSLENKQVKDIKIDGEPVILIADDNGLADDAELDNNFLEELDNDEQD